MSNPLKIMDVIEVRGLTNDGGAFISRSEIQSLRSSIEAQAAELAQARARIGRLEAGVVLAIHSLRDHWQAGGTALLVASGLQDIVNESEPQSLAAVRAEALRSAASAMQLEFDANHLFIMADRIEREAKESK